MTSPYTRIEQHIATARSAVTADLATITDPIDREYAARQILGTLLPDFTQDVKEIRSSAVRDLKQGRTLAEVGALLGGLSTARVDQIIKAGTKK
ncbi:hypothetical protein AB0E67_16840 [Streptomyces sp. NPDC032161]|uniref:hypothetical protein n=1 Tax=unclassified Streptomyces TaxID=2593676 RepID=UPI0033C662C0